MIIAIAARQTEASTQLDLVSVSCKLVPLHWRACLQKARIEMAERKLDDARITVLNTLELDPWNFSALKHMANIAFQQNRPVEGCFYLWKYEDIFRVNESAPSTTMTLRYEQNCPERVREYLKKNRPKRYLR
ncbi:MAG: hypothetical protein M9962_03760 [Oligoflexia bacterium]|nr:hypothetical protein [Oligoflexia bacterium]